MNIVIFILISVAFILGNGCVQIRNQYKPEQPTKIQWEHFLGSSFLERQFPPRSRVISSKSTSETLLVHADDLELHIRKLHIASEAEAHNFFEDRKIYLHRLFQVHTDPYWGAPSNDERVCMENNILETPIVDSLNTLSIQFHLHANADKVIGTCEKKDKSLALHMQILYCKKYQTIFDIRYYSPQLQDKMPKDVELGTCG